MSMYLYAVTRDKNDVTTNSVVKQPTHVREEDASVRHSIDTVSDVRVNRSIDTVSDVRVNRSIDTVSYVRVNRIDTVSDVRVNCSIDSVICQGSDVRWL